MRSGLTVIVASTVVLASCTRMPTPQEANDAVLMLREYDDWAWAVGIALVWADVVLPVPQTAVIAALGIVYGPLLGGLLGSLGLITGGLLRVRSGVYLSPALAATLHTVSIIGPDRERLRTERCLGDRPDAWPSLQASVDARPGWAGKSTAVSLRRESAYAHLPRARSRSARSSRHGR